MPPKTTFWGWRNDLRDPQIKDISQVIIITILPVILVKLLPVGWGNRQKLFGESIFPCHSCPAMFCGIYDFGSIMINESFFFTKINFRVPEGCHFCQHLVLFGSSLLPYLRKSKHHWQQFEYFIRQHGSLHGKLLSLTFTAWAVCNDMWTCHFLPNLLSVLWMKKCCWEMLFLLWLHKSRKHYINKRTVCSLCYQIKFLRFSSTCL